MKIQISLISFFLPMTLISLAFLLLSIDSIIFLSVFSSLLVASLSGLTTSIVLYLNEKGLFIQNLSNLLLDQISDNIAKQIAIGNLVRLLSGIYDTNNLNVKTSAEAIEMQISIISQCFPIHHGLPLNDRSLYFPFLKYRPKNKRIIEINARMYGDNHMIEALLKGVYVVGKQTNLCAKCNLNDEFKVECENLGLNIIKLLACLEANSIFVREKHEWIQNNMKQFVTPLSNEAKLLISRIINQYEEYKKK